MLTKIITKAIAVIALLLLSTWVVVTQPILPVTRSSLETHIDTRLLESYVIMLSETLPPRVAYEKTLQPTVNWIESQLQKYGQVTRQSYQVDNETFHNLAISFGPKTNTRIIIGAHYDTYDGFPGADDNASGIAALIELARLLSTTTDLKTQVDLVAYTLEEPPFFRTENMGSFVHAAKTKEQQVDVKLMIAIDMIGYFSDEANSQQFVAPLIKPFYPDKGNFIGLVSNLNNMGAIRKVKKSFQRATDLDVRSFNAPALFPGVDFSDHLNYWHYDYPAIMVTDTAFSRNKNYHTAQDTAEKLDYKSMAEVIKALYQTTLDFAAH